MRSIERLVAEAVLVGPEGIAEDAVQRVPDWPVQ